MAKRKLDVEIGGDSKGAESALRNTSAAADKTGGKFNKFKRVAATAFAAVAAAGVAAAVKGVQSAAELEQGMNEVFTLLPGISQDAMDDLTDQVKDFAVEFGVLPNEVVPALYQALSAGVPKDNVFEFLETAQMAARGGVTDLETAVDGISSVINAYGEDVINATQASDLMFTAVRLGKTNFEQLSQSLFNVIPTAAGLGVEFADVTAALAALTAAGVPTSVATTQLRQMFVELSKDGGELASTFEELAGEKFADFIASGNNTADALELLQEHAADTGVSVQDLFGSVEAGGAALALTGPGMDVFRDNLDAMGDSAGATEEAHDQMAQGLSFQLDKLRAMAEVALIELGERLLPILTSLAIWVQEKLVPALRDIWSWLDQNVVPALKTAGDWFSDNEDAVKILAIALVGLVAAFIAIKLAAIAAFLTSPIGLFVLAITALIAIGVFLFQNWDTIRAKAEEIWPGIGDTISGVVDFVKDVIDRGVALATAIWENFGDDILAFASSTWETIKLMIEGAINVVRGIIRVVTSLIRGDWAGVWEGIKLIFSGVWSGIKAIANQSIAAVRFVISVGLTALQRAWEVVWRNLSSFVSDIFGGIIDTIGGAVSWVVDRISDIGDAISNIPGAGAIRGLVGRIPGLAHGGLARAGEMHIVGEEGPEIFVPNKTGRILPNDGDSSFTAAGSGGDTIIIDLSGAIISSERQAEEWVTRAVNRAARKGRDIRVPRS